MAGPMYNSAEKQSSGKRNIMKAEPKEIGEDYTLGKWGQGAPEGKDDARAAISTRGLWQNSREFI